MTRYKSCADLKDMAKAKLERNYLISIFVILTVTILEYSVSLFITDLIPANTMPQFFIYLTVNFLLSVFLGIFKVGTNLFFLNMACGQPYKMEQIFYGYQNHAGSSFMVSLVTGLVSFLGILPSNILLRLFYETQDQKYLTLAFIMAIIGFLIQYPFTLALSQSFFLLLDFPDYSAKQVLFASCKIMKHNKWRLFRLQLSFLPLMLLCVLTFYIGFLWLMPYMNMTYTLFFLDIMKSTNETTQQ